ncbi:type II toxin-antitoxin system RelE/ParE family toxin [uncultured Algibacter sp.]|uniref:type II toxin-antitoxin system RelE/ParE family toxin n=1 Tax=uncultured Algibacter sp. TaxID=298659 RepID=UPI0032176387
MDYKLNVWNEVKINIIDGFKRYEDKRIGLGGEFVNEVEDMLNYIQKYPEHFQIKHRNRYREAVLKRFPYIIIYEIIDNIVVVFEVFPTKDDPDNKVK